MKITIRYNDAFLVPSMVSARVVSNIMGSAATIELTTEQARVIMFKLADQLGYTLSNRTTSKPGQTIDPAFLSVCPTGYETLIGYMARKGMDIDPSYGASQGRALAQYAKGFSKATRGNPIRVPAPQVLHEDQSGMRIEEVNAYPTWMIDSFFREQDYSPKKVAYFQSLKGACKVSYANAEMP